MKRLSVHLVGILGAALLAALPAWPQEAAPTTPAPPPTQTENQSAPSVPAPPPETSQQPDVSPAAPKTAPDANVDPLAGKNVERVDVTGNTSIATDTIRVYLGITPGQPYDPGKIRANFPNLWQTGLFDDIQVDAEPGDSGGVVIKVTVVERPRIGAVEYRGNKALSNTQILEALQRDKIDLHIGNTVEQILIRRAAESIRKAYAEAGQEGVTVETLLEDMDTPGDKRVVFKIDEGVKARVAGIYFEGNTRFSDRKLRRTMKEVKKHNLITWIRKKNIYTPSKLQEDLERIRNLYQDYGYKDIAFGEPKIETLRGRKPRVKVTVPVHEGVVHKFSSIEVDGNTVFTTEQMIGRFPLHKGDTLSRKPIQDRIDLFEELYQRRGYIYAFIDPEYVDVDDILVDVKLHVYEGEQFHLGRLEFQGNTVTKDKVLRREIFLAEGDVMDMEAFKTSIYKLGQLGYFKITDNPDFKVNQEEKTVDITVKGKEEGKNDIQFGGGYSEAFGFFAQFQFNTRNFLGEGETFGISVQQGRQQDFFSLSYADPWFLDRPQSFGVSIFNRQTILPSTVGFESRSKGGTIAYGFRIGRFEGISFQYGFEDVKEKTTYQPAPDAEGNVPLPRISNINFTTSAFVPSYNYDSRDNPFDTSRGMKATLSLGYTGGPFGGTIDLIKPVGAFSYFKPVTRRSTISFNIEGGQIFSQGKNCAEKFADLSDYGNVLCVPRSERFYVGGEQSIRGFQSYSLGPREVVNGSSILVGGYKYAVTNVEYVYHVNEPLRFVLFGDAGQAFGFDQSWDFGALRYSAGAELRIFLPVFQFPLRFIWAKNLSPEPNDLFQSFQFSIGNTF